jgi:2-polyprenyl-6-methoxyphenol hydroxylase-like FAD-dependent oxidoreductase
MLPPGHTWNHVPGVALLGDAAHLTTPFAGEGVNAAMLDGVELAEEIISALGKEGNPPLSAVVREYEAKVVPRVAEVQEETWQNLQVVSQDDAPDGFVEIMLSHGPPPEE